MKLKSYLVVFGMLLVCVLCVGIGYNLGSSSPASKMAEHDLSATELERVERLFGLKVIGHAGPFYVLANDARDHYVVARGKEPMLVELNEGTETTLVLNGREGGVSCHLTYELGTNRLLRGAYSVQLKGGHIGPVERFYHDVDGDGVFDRLVDLEGGTTYDLRTLSATMESSEVIGQ